MERAVLVYTTYPSVVEAEKAGRRWSRTGSRPASTSCPDGLGLSLAGSGRARRGSGDDHQDPCIARGTGARGVKATHPYDTPAILVLPIESVDERYFAWILVPRPRRRGVTGQG